MIRRTLRWSVLAAATAGVAAAPPPPSILSVPNASSGFALAVASDGKVAVAGDPMSGAQNAATGAVHVFAWDGKSWTPDGTLEPKDVGDGAWFGNAVQVDGGRLLVGAPELKPNTTGDAVAVIAPGKAPWSRNAPHRNSGGVYVFRRQSSGWIQQERLVGSQSRVGANFGKAVAVDHDSLVVGAPGEDLRKGAVYVFRRTPNGWREEARLAPDRPEIQYGEVVAVSGDTLVVGGGRMTRGADVFRRIAGVWRKEATLSDPAPVAQTGFGGAVAISSEAMLVAAPLINDIYKDQPVVHLFRRRGTAWLAVAQLQPATKPPDFGFGRSIALTDGVASILGGRKIYRFRLGAAGATLVGTTDLTPLGSNVYARSVATTSASTLVGAAVPNRAEGANVLVVYSTPQEK